MSWGVRAGHGRFSVRTHIRERPFEASCSADREILRAHVPRLGRREPVEGDIVALGRFRGASMGRSPIVKIFGRRPMTNVSARPVGRRSKIAKERNRGG
jgi:hypothetical protein